MISIVGKNVTELMHKATHYMLNRKPDIDIYQANSLHLFDMCLRAKSCKYEMDIRKDLWLTRKKWTSMLRQYIDPEKLDLFVTRSKLILSGEARNGASTDMLFKDPVSDQRGHKWGGCLLALTFRGDYASEPTITLYSRTAYMGYIAFLDAAIPATIVLKEILPIDDLTVDNVCFQWHITSTQLHTFKILPYIHSQPDLLKELKYWSRHRSSLKKSGKNAVWKNAVRWYCKMIENLDEYGAEEMLIECKHGGWRRIQQRWLEHVRELPKKNAKSLLITNLDFRRLK